jgi:hypothetical protein
MDSQRQRAAAWKEEAAAITRGWREKGEERKKEERGKEESLTWFKLFTSRANRTGATGGHVAKGGWAASRVRRTGTTRVDVVPHHHLGMWQPYVVRQCKWRDSFMSCVNRTGTTENSQI